MNRVKIYLSDEFDKFLAFNSFVGKYNLFIEANDKFPLYLSSLSSSDLHKDLSRLLFSAVYGVGEIKYFMFESIS